jgi:hypothetical protein
MNTNQYSLLWIFAVLSLAVSCGDHADQTSDKQEKKERKKERQEAKRIERQGFSATTDQEKGSVVTCDTSLWKYVYNRERLHVIERCKTVTGTIEESNADEDGDQHVLLKLDAGQEDLLTKRNKRKKQGDLVIEAVCINKVMLRKVGTTCTGYVSRITLPNLGDHVRVTGSLVNDTHNGWNEIHPITQLEIIK